MFEKLQKFSNFGKLREFGVWKILKIKKFGKFS